MCLLVLAWRTHPRYRLIVAANRDEYHERPAAPLARWEGNKGIIAGRDLRAGGTWLGVNTHQHVGVVTNYRDLQRPREGAPSRGALIPAFLSQGGRPAAFFKALEPRAADYSGFNLLLADDNELWYGSNRATSFARALAAGVYGLSNHLLDTPWPKLVQVRRQFEQWLQASSASPEEELFAILADREPAENDSSPVAASIPPDLKKALSAPFVLYPTYGTRCSTVTLVEPSGRLRIIERRFDANGTMTGDSVFED